MKSDSEILLFEIKTLSDYYNTEGDGNPVIYRPIYYEKNKVADKMGKLADRIMINRIFENPENS